MVPRSKFNSFEVHRDLNLQLITTTDMAVYVVFLHEALSEIVSFSRHSAGDGGLMNITLGGASLTSDVNTILSPSNCLVSAMLLFHTIYVLLFVWLIF